MKNIIMAFTATIVSAVLINNSAEAQSPAAAGNDYHQLAVATSQKFLSENVSAVSVENSTASISMRALKDFKKTFVNAANAEWEITTDGGFVASFTAEDKKALVAYNSAGQWQHTVYYYGAEKLPEDIKASVLDAYGDFKIIQVNEIKVPFAPVIYLVHLENTATFRTIRVCEDEMDEIETIYKQ